jgi:hypothetical protein
MREQKINPHNRRDPSSVIPGVPDYFRTVADNGRPRRRARCCLKLENLVVPLSVAHPVAHVLLAKSDD